MSHRNSRRNQLGSRRSATGFTLVELLVVIGIIAVLVSLLMPSLGKARQSANTIKCASNMRNIGLAMQNYAAMNKGAIVPAAIKYTASWNTVSWDILLKPYLGIPYTAPMVYNGVDYIDAPIIQCPSDYAFRTAMSDQAWKRSYSMVSARPRNPDPANGETFAPILGTGMCTDASGTGGAMPGNYPGFKFLKFANVRQSSETLLLVENHTNNFPGGGGYDATFGSSVNAAISQPRSQFGDFAGKNWVAGPAHNNMWNYLMCDGSVQLLAPQDTLKGTAKTIMYQSFGDTQYRATIAGGRVNYMWTIYAGD